MRAGVGRFIGFMSFLALSGLANAQVIPPSERPGRESQRFAEPPEPRALPRGPVVTLPGTVAPPGAAEIRILLRGVRIEGSTVYSAQELEALADDLVGRSVSLQKIYVLAQRITAKYGADGYVLSRAIVPPQKLNPKGAIIRLRVIEGWIDKVEWPEKLNSYRDFFSEYSAKIIAQRPANIRTIERYLLLAGDLPGLKFSSVLRASKDNPNTSTLIVEVSEKPVDAIVHGDNRGTAARGPYQILSSGSVNNALGLHEQFSLTYAAAFPFRELQYLSANYRQVLTSEGLTAFVNASNGWGWPGTAALERLQYKTRSTMIDAGASYPIIRAREQNLTISGLGFVSDSRSNTFGAPYNTDRLRGFRVRVDGDLADQWGGVNQLNFTFSQGIGGLGSTANGNLLATRAAGRVDFSKVEGTISRTQPLVDRFSAFVSWYGQFGFTPLLSPEQCGYGGRFFGRAFDPSQLLGDSCWMAIGELRYDLPGLLPELSHAQLYAFADHGRTYVRAPALGTDGDAGGTSAGTGLRFALLDHFDADLQAAKAVDGPRHSWRFFFSVNARY
jgi:hemolysin activation/secretion protein